MVHSMPHEQLVSVSSELAKQLVDGLSDNWSQASRLRYNLLPPNTHTHHPPFISAHDCSSPFSGTCNSLEEGYVVASRVMFGDG